MSLFRADINDFFVEITSEPSGGLVWTVRHAKRGINVEGTATRVNQAFAAIAGAIDEFEPEKVEVNK